MRPSRSPSVTKGSGWAATSTSPVSTAVFMSGKSITNYGTLGVPVVEPDITGQEFDARWQNVPRSQRALLRFAFRGFKAARRTMLSRRVLAWMIKQITPRVNGDDSWSPVFKQTDDLLGARRDRKLEEGTGRHPPRARP
jgi:hypothetical protein